MESLYQAKLMDHYKYPRNRHMVANPNFSSALFNPSCGDQIICSGTISDTVISNIGFDGKGCVISLATASILSEYVLHKSVQDIQLISTNDMYTMIGITVGPTRTKCVLLCLEALQSGILEYEKKL